MSKKYILTIIPTIIILFLFVFVLFNKKKSIKDTIEAIPEDACIIIKTDGLSRMAMKFPYQNKIWGELIQLDNFKKIHQQIIFIDSVLNNTKDLFSLNEYPIAISFHLMGKNSIENLILLNSKNKFSAKKIIDKLTNIYPNKIQLSSRKYENTKIYKLQYSIDSTEQNLYVSSNKGIILFSLTPILIENSIRQLNNNSGLQKKYEFLKISETAGSGVDGNIYLNMKSLPKLLSLKLNNTYQNALFSIPQIANRTELDLKITNKALLFYGYTYSNDSSNNYMNIYRAQSPQKIESYQILPANTSWFVCLGFNNFPSFNAELQKYYKAHENLKGLNTHLNYLNKKYNTNINELFNSFIDNEVCKAITNESSLSEKENNFITIKTISKSIAKEKLLNWLKTIAKTNNKKLSDYKNKIKIDAETSFDVYKMPVEDLYGCLFGKIFGEYNYQFFTFIDNYLIIGNSQNALSKFIHYSILNKTLITNENFIKTAEHLSNRTNFYFYCNLQQSGTSYTKYLKPNVSKDILKLKKIQACGYQFHFDDDLIINNLVFQYNDDKPEEEPHTQWETLLDTVTDSKPAFVINHYTSENEIFIQDLNNNIYLINQAGRILWKLKIDEKISSNIYQIDFYKNNKLQMLFSTKNKIYLLDRNGNSLERYPIKLRAPATNGIALFDYEKNKDYRIFIACEDKKIYSYNKNGNLIKGWGFDKTDNIVKSEIQHFKIDTKDYIVFADSYKIYILNRKGENRVKVLGNIAKSVNNNFILEEESRSTKTRFATTDTLGNVIFIYLDGKTEIINFKGFSANHFFDYQDINGDMKKEYIFLDKNMLYVYDNIKNELFDKTFESKKCLKPIIFNFSHTDKKIGIVNKENQKIYLINNNGKTYEGFPLKGQTLFSIGKFENSNGKFNLIVGNNDKFLYNYTIQ